MWAQGSALRRSASFCPWHGTQASPYVPQDKEQAMLLTLVLTAQSAVTDPVEMHACQPTHWFSRLLCCRTMLVQLEMTPSMWQGVGYPAGPPTSFCIPVSENPCCEDSI